jgi:hypothetical protein
MPNESQPPPYSRSETSNSPNRPGVFPDLNGFIQPPRTSRQRVPKPDDYSNLTTANPEVGDIIHILEDNHSNTRPHASCLHQRVMLVIRHDKPIKGTCRSLTCVPLCRHISGVETGTGQSHWNVEQVPEDGKRLQKKRDDDSPALAVWLGSEEHVLLAGITVNLAEIWHVEYEGVAVRDLGRVPSQKNLDLALTRVAGLFDKSVRPKLVDKKTRRK